jgi:OOP family OmpA-OmpF porin
MYPKRHREHRGSLFGAAVIFTIAASLSACAPIPFEGTNALAVMGDLPPAPEPEPEPEPEPPPKRVEVKDNKIVINEKIQFELNRAKILTESDSLLTEVAKVINENPRLKRIAVEGHASSEGSERRNRSLSDQRAKAVMKYLVSRGKVDANRLTAKGFGADRPVADNGTETGREKNRRVEFVIVEQSITQRKVEIDPDTGKETVLEETTKDVKSAE